MIRQVLMPEPEMEYVLKTKKITYAAGAVADRAGGHAHIVIHDHHDGGAGRAACGRAQY